MLLAGLAVQRFHRVDRARIPVDLLRAAHSLIPVESETKPVSTPTVSVANCATFGTAHVANDVSTNRAKVT